MPGDRESSFERLEQDLRATRVWADDVLDRLGVAEARVRELEAELSWVKGSSGGPFRP